jgi:hypothetical protein
VRPTADTNVEKILSAPVPKSKRVMRSLCGAVGFLRKFIPNCAGILRPLTDLTAKKCSDHVDWGPKQQAALDELKILLTSKPVLRLYDVTKKHTIQTDASDGYIGGVLLQEENGELYAVMYTSRKLLPRETRYAIGEKEMLAIVWCCTKFYKYIYGAKFVVQTDCQSSSILNGKVSNNARVMR